MKTKKIVSMVLAIIMVVGLLPMAAIAEGTQNLIATVHGTGEYTDMNSIPEKSYQYTVKGSDGSTSLITMLGTEAETGNTVITSPVYYERLESPEEIFMTAGVITNRIIIATDKYNPDNGTLAVNANDLKTNNVTVKHDPVKGEILEGDYSDYEWQVTSRITENNAYSGSFKNKKGKTISLDRNGNVTLSDGVDWFDVNESINQGHSHDIRSGYVKFVHWFERANWYNSDFWLFLDVKGNGQSLGYLNDSNKSAVTPFKLYKKAIDTDSDTIYSFDLSALEALIKEAEKREFAKNYEENSWNIFAGALADAKRVLEENRNSIFDNAEAANSAIATVDAAHLALQNAINGLQIEIGLNECVMPEITWTRSYGDASNDPKDERVLGLSTVEDNAENNFPIIWKWDSIKNIQASSTTPWYVNNKGMSVGTWADQDDGWTKSSVRRISGTFIWPYGYDINDKAEILSVNDSVDKKSGAYADIYKYIEDNKNTPEGEKIYNRYKNSRVFAVNDNMYVFISKADEQPSDWTAEQAAQRMAFWTGTDGKGVWTSDKTGADWDRTTPATFLGKAAVPSFYKVWPNVEDMNIADGNAHNDANIVGWNGKNLNNSTAHSSGWYSLADTSNIMTTLKNTYGAEDLGGQKMRIEVFAFDNSGEGGMDELQLRICSPSADDIPVQVDYFMNVGGNRIKLDNMSTIFYTTEGAHHVLPNGTFVNELNYAKAEAERKAPEGTQVSDGRQINMDFEAHRGQTNIIQVEYTATLKDMEFMTYDFATKNEFTYHDDSTTDITSVLIEGIPGLTVKNFSNASHDITLEYTPEKSFDQAKLGSIVITRAGSTTKLPIGVVPASNVLYEENFMSPRNTTKAPDWRLTNNTAANVTVTDNERNESVFGYTSAYATNRGQNGAYEVEVDSSNTGRASEDLAFDFNGQGFDLIGTCGPNTGTIMVSVRDDQNQAVKVYMVNTSFADDTIHQVPLVHCMDLPRGTYHVLVKAMYVDYAPQQTKMSYSLRNSASTPNNAAYNALVRMGLSDDEISKVEFINIADVLGASTFSLRNAPVVTYEAPATMTVALDSFRVYRSTQNATEAYPADECDIHYSNILDATSGNFSAYIEGNADGTFNVETYRQQGGPAKELYLKPNTSVAIAVADGVTDTQISVRALTAQAKMSVNEGPDQFINHNTEMYYRVTAQNGLIVIANRSNNILAIGNLKCAVQSINNEQKKQAEQMTFRMMNAPETPDAPEVGTFIPERFNVKLNVINGIFNRFGTLRITASKDVQYVEINGVKTQADNRLLVNWGLAKNLKYTKRKNVKKGEVVEFKIVAYDNLGNPSEPIIISK